MVDAFADLKDEQQAEDVELSENVVEDFVEYFRGDVVGHEEEGTLMWLGMLTGYVADENVHTNVAGIGSPGSGKSLTKNIVVDALPSRDIYTKTDASDNALLDSVEWDCALAAPLDEYDKLSGAIREFLKSMNAEDGGYSKDRNVEDPDSLTGYTPTEVSSDPIPWTILYAPTSRKASLDDELEDRACILYFTNTKNTRRGIGRKEWGHESITPGGEDSEYIYDNQPQAIALRQRVRSLSVRREYETVENDDGEEIEQLAGRYGDEHVYTPPWCWYVVEPIFDIDEDYTNRVFGITHDLVAASAMVNKDNRERTTIDVYVDEDSLETEERVATVVGPQDLANVLSCLPTLLSTTHQLTPLKRKVLDAVDATEPITDGDGTTVQKIRDWLDENDIPHPSQTKLREVINELDEEYYLQSWENAGGKNGTATVYERHDEGALQTPNIYDLQRYAERDGIELATGDCVDIDPERPFEGINDPIRDQPFEETVDEFEQKFSGSEKSVETDAAAYMGGDPHSDDDTTSASESAESDDSGGQATLSGVNEDGVEETVADTQSVDLDPEGEPANLTEKYILEQLREHAAGKQFGGGHDITHFLGIVEDGQHSVDVDMSDTVVDPDHELWQNRPDHRDDRVVSEADALKELKESYDKLRDKNLVVEDDDGGPPAMFTLHTADS